MPASLGRIGLLCLGILGGVGLGEVGIRAYLKFQDGQHLERMLADRAVTKVETDALGDVVRPSQSRELVYELKPNLRGQFMGANLRTNTFGMRGFTQPSFQPGPETLRIVGLGDSFMFGQRVDESDTYLQRLGQILGRDPEISREPEVLNMAVPGYNAHMMAAALEYRGRRFDPHVVVVGLTGNDWDLPTFLMERPYGTLEHSFFLGALLGFLSPPQSLRLAPTDPDDPTHFLSIPDRVPDGYAHMVGYGGFRQALESIVKDARAGGAQVVLFSDCVSKTASSTPTCGYPYEPGQWEALRDILLESPEVTVCTWRMAPEHVIPGDGHPNAAGHRALAEQLYRCMKDFDVVAE